MEFDRLVVGFLADEVVGGFFISVPPGHIACVYDRGRGVLPKVWGPGLHTKIPFWQIAKMFNAQTQEYTIREGFDISNKEALGDKPINAYTKDGYHVQMEGSILFKLDKARAPQLWENIGDHFVSKVVRPLSRSHVAHVLSEFSLDELQKSRPVVEKALAEALNEKFSPLGLWCEGVLPSELKVLDHPETRFEDKKPTKTIQRSGEILLA